MGCANVNDNWSSDTKLFPKSAAAKGISLNDFGNSTDLHIQMFWSVFELESNTLIKDTFCLVSCIFSN